MRARPTRRLSNSHAPARLPRGRPTAPRGTKRFEIALRAFSTRDAAASRNRAHWSNENTLRSPKPTRRAPLLTSVHPDAHRYVDLGEEDDWTAAQPGASDDEEEAADGKKRKKGGDEKGDAKKAKQEKADKKDRQRLANMFAKNAAAAAGGVKRNRLEKEAKQPDAGAMDADDLLESILAGVGSDDAPARPAPRAAPAAFPANQFRRPAPSQPPPWRPRPRPRCPPS